MWLKDPLIRETGNICLKSKSGGEFHKEIILFSGTFSREENRE